MKRKQASVFDAVALLDQQDAKAAKSQRRVSERERQRSLAAQSQTEIFGKLVETRILLQRSLHHHAATRSSEENKEVSATVDTATATSSSPVDQCNDLLARLLRARQTLFPIQQKQQQEQDDDDDDDDDNDNSRDSGEDHDDNKPNYEALVQSSSSSSNNLELLSNTLQSEYEHYEEGWKEVLDRRNKDVRLHSGATHKTQFRVMDASFWQQVENTVQHEELRQKQEQQQQQHQSSDSALSTTAPTIFDDTKVYQQLLKDFVSVKGGGTASSSSDAIQQRKQSKAANKKNPQVDRRASKGRKIRYTEIQKLANFTFPISRPLNGSTGGGAGNDLDEDAWFKSLFGGAARSK